MILTDENLHYLLNVVRAKAGTSIETYDGIGGLYQWEITELSRKTAHLNRTSSRQTERKSPVILRLGLNPLKGGSEEYAIRMAAAMEVAELKPVFFKRSDVPFDENMLEKRLDRWFRICLNEVALSGSAYIPEISKPIQFEDLVGSTRPRTIVFYEQADPIQGDVTFTNGEEILALIGPEGGIDDGEAERARKNGCEITSLGDWTLRAQLAAAQVPSWVYSKVK